MYESENKSFTVKDLPANERPRERMINHGADKLSNAELLAIILRTGTKGENVITIANNLLRHFGSLENVLNASIEEITSIKGLGKAKACQLAASFTLAKRAYNEMRNNEKKQMQNHPVTSPLHALEIIRREIIFDKTEQFYVLFYDIRNRYCGCEKISEGSLTATVVHPREAFNRAIKRHAASIMVAHNHPSGDTEPSDVDINITKRLAEAGKIIGIELLDHIIVTQTGYYSFKENGRL